MVLDLHAVGLKLTAGCQVGELSHSARAAIVAGGSQPAVAGAFGVDRKAVRRALSTFESSDAMASRPRSGQPAIHPRRQKRGISELAKPSPRLTMDLTKNHR